MTRAEAPALTQGERQVLESIALDRMWRDLEFLSGFDRASGTEGERRAMDYIAERLRADGIAVDVAAFDAYLSYPIAGSIAVVAAHGLPPEIKAKTRAFSANTPAEGISGSLVYVPGGTDLFRDTETHKRLAGAGIAGKIVLSEAGSRRNMQAAQEAGAVAYVHTWPSEEDAIHEGIVSPVWGAPTPATAAAFPRIPILSVTKKSGDELRAALERGPVTLRVHSRAETGWRRVTLPVASIPGQTAEFVLFSGHVDSWHLGATDNATGNVVTMEAARVFHAHRRLLRRGIKCAFWPGHSTGRYAGSSWYADQHWHELHEHCVLHINCDSPGVVGATEYDPVTATADAADFAVGLIKEVAGQDVGWERPVRAGDQSFWGPGVPSLLMGSSMRPKGQRWAVGGSGLGWWWHTEDDTIDKVDRKVLDLDARIYLLAAYRFAVAAVLPLRVTPAVAELRAVALTLAQQTGARFDWIPLSAAMERLAAAARGFDAAADAAAGTAAAETAGAEATADGRDADRVAIVGRAQRAAIRTLIQVGYTGGSPFDHDPAVPQSPLPSLQDARELAGMAPDSHQARVLYTHLVRRRNKVVFNLLSAARALEGALAALD